MSCYLSNPRCRIIHDSEPSSSELPQAQCVLVKGEYSLNWLGAISQVYAADGFLSWADWLGYGEGKPVFFGSFLPFQEARAEARKLARDHKLVTQRHWQIWCASCAPLSAYE
jgi:hypothetical protein